MVVLTYQTPKNKKKIKEIQLSFRLFMLDEMYYDQPRGFLVYEETTAVCFVYTIRCFDLKILSVRRRRQPQCDISTMNIFWLY